MILTGWPTLGWDFWLTLAIGGGFGFCVGYFVAVMLTGKSKTTKEQLKSHKRMRRDE